MTTNNTPKIGLIDVETAPMEANVWGLFDQNVGLNQIITEWTLLSFCLKPLHGPRKSIEYRDNRDAASPRDDSALLHRLWEIMHEYDILIAQNGKRFDKKKIIARLILAGYSPPSPVRIEDTMLMAKQVASFTSNKLEWLTTYLSDEKKSNHKEFPGFELWKECLAGNPRAWAAMKKYNVKDVTSMEDVYLKLRPWVRGHQNIAVFGDSEKMMCPVCGSHKLRADGYSYTGVGQYRRYQCRACGSWSRSRFTLNTVGKRKSLLTSLGG